MRWKCFGVDWSSQPPIWRGVLVTPWQMIMSAVGGRRGRRGRFMILHLVMGSALAAMTWPVATKVYVRAMLLGGKCYILAAENCASVSDGV